MTVPRKRRKVNYVNNRDFYNAIVEYRNKCKVAEAEGKQIPVMSRYIGECISEIAKRYSTKPMFSGYVFRDEMIEEAVLNCILYFHNFNPDKGDNPFAYFTQVIKNSYWRTIRNEKKKLYTKFKMMIETNISNSSSAVQEHDQQIYNDYIKQSEGSRKYMENFIRDFEESERKRKEKASVPKEEVDES